MTIREFYTANAHEGRAVLLRYSWGGMRLWIVRIGEEYVRCDDSDSGHLERLDPSTDIGSVIRRWKASRGLYAASHPANPHCGRKRSVQPSKWGRHWPNPRKRSVAVAAH